MYLILTLGTTDEKIPPGKVTSHNDIKWVLNFLISLFLNLHSCILDIILIFEQISQRHTSAYVLLISVVPLHSSFTCCKLIQCHSGQTGIYFFKVNYENTRPISEIYSKLTIKIPEQQRLQL